MTISMGQIAGLCRDLPAEAQQLIVSAWLRRRPLECQRLMVSAGMTGTDAARRLASITRLDMTGRRSIERISMNLRDLAREFGTEPNTLREFAPDETTGYDDLDSLPPENLAVIRAAWAHWNPQH
jgi:hypothetical protein